MTIPQTAARLRRREVSAVELVDDVLYRIASADPHLNAFLTLTEESARRRARELDELLAAGTDLGPLHGIPIAHKDCLRTAGVRTTAGSKIFTDYVPKHSAEVVTRLERAGAILIGKTGLHEFTYGISGVNPHYGPVRNPWNPECVSGGSSSGSGAAVAAGLVPLATGTDTGGSIRIPASFCGCVGLKPTYGQVSRRGVMPLGPSQDHVGPMTRTVEDCAIAFRVMAGLTAATPARSGDPVSGVRIGVPRDYFWDHCDPEVAEYTHRAIRMLEELGAEIREIDLPGMPQLMDAARISLLAEAAAVLGRYSTNPEDFGNDVAALLDQGRAVTAVDYLNARRVRNGTKRKLAAVWRDVDCLLSPTTPITAFRIDQTEVLFASVKTDVRAVSTRLTRPFNALGWPALSLPCGFTQGKLPVGLQLVAAPGQEERLFQVGQALEEVLLVN